MDIMKLKNAKRSSSSGGEEKFNVAVMIKDFEIAGDSPNRKEDVAIGYLLHDACGLEAEYGPYLDESGNPVMDEATGQPVQAPITEVRFKIYEVKKRDGGVADNPSVYTLKNGGENHKKVSPGATVILQGASLDRDGRTLSARWANNAIPKPNMAGVSKYVVGPAFMRVDPERFNRNDNRKSVQLRYVAETDRATVVNNVDEFSAAAASFLAEEKAFGLPEVILRAVDPESAVSVSAQLYLSGDKDENTGEWTQHSAEESVAKFLQHNEQWVEALNSGAFHFEVIPVTKVFTGADSKPSKKKNQADVSKVYTVSNEVDDFGNHEYGWAESLMVLHRSEEDAPWVAIETQPVSANRAVILESGQLPTPNLSPELQTKLREMAAERTKQKFQRNDNANENDGQKQGMTP